jgi:signal transduction histidine kinase/CheY-like chemotaxis protein
MKKVNLPVYKKNRAPIKVLRTIGFVLFPLFILIILFLYINWEVKKSDKIISQNVEELYVINEIRELITILTLQQYHFSSAEPVEQISLINSMNKIGEKLKLLVTKVHSTTNIDKSYTKKLFIAVEQVIDANNQIVNANKKGYKKVEIEDLQVDYSIVFEIASFHLKSVAELSVDLSHKSSSDRYDVVLKVLFLSLILIIIVALVFIILLLGRQKVEASLSDLEGYLLDVFESMPVALVGLNRFGEVIRLNKKAQEISQKDEFLFPLKIETLFPFLDDVKTSIKNDITSKSVDNYKISLKDSGLIYSVTIFPLVSTREEGAVVLIDDITQEELLKEELHQTQKMNVIGQLAGGVAHDFNNMLGGIMNSVELIRVGCDKEEEDMYLEIIMTASEKATGLTQKLLSFSKKSIQDETIFSINTILESTILLLNATLDKNITVTFQSSSKHLFMQGDNSQIQNIFINLGINAGQAMESGGTILFSSSLKTISQEYCDNSKFDIAPGDYAVIEVVDSGSGISENILKRIFEPFFTTKKTGTGIGLASVKNSVVKHSGEILVESTVGSGTTFSLLFPVEEQGDDSESTASFIIPKEKQNVTILVIDDEAVMRKSSALMLKKLGFNVVTAENGLEGFEMFSREQEAYSLILLDMIMPVLSGVETLKKIREISLKIPVVICTGYSQSDDLDRAKEIGISGLLSKPYHIKEIQSIVTDAIYSE